MTEAVLNWPEILVALKAELRSVENSSGEPAFADVFISPPASMPLGGPYAFAWYEGRGDPRKAGGARTTLGNVMYSATIPIACFWLWQPERSTREAWEADIATIDTGIRRVIRANSTINNNLTDLDIEDSRDNAPYLEMPQVGGKTALYRALQMNLILDNLEGEAISATN